MSDGHGMNAAADARPLLVDTHVHLNLKDYHRDRAEVIARARRAGVEFMINVGFDLETCLASVELAERHDFIRASVGVHPHNASELTDDLLARLEELAEHPRVLAVGETGLDYYRDLSPETSGASARRAQQRRAGRCR